MRLQGLSGDRDEGLMSDATRTRLRPDEAVKPASSGPHGASTEGHSVPKLGLGSEVLGAFGIALASLLYDPVAFAHQPSVWLFGWIVLFPLVAPASPPLKTVLASLSAATAGPIVLLLA